MLDPKHEIEVYRALAFMAFILFAIVQTLALQHIV